MPQHLANDARRRALLLAAVVVLTSMTILMTEKKEKRRGQGPRRLLLRPDYEKSVWWCTLQQPDLDDPNSRAHQQFRRRFGLPPSEFHKLVAVAKTWDIFAKVGDHDAVGRKTVPLEMKVLGALRYLCKGASFDSISELSGVSEQTIQQFFNKFIPKMRDELLHVWVRHPTTYEEAEPIIDDFRRLGFDGCLGSVDCTHIAYGMGCTVSAAVCPSA